MLSPTEENYIKSIFHLSEDGQKEVSTNTISDEMNTSAASVTDMIKKLALKKLLDYRKYKGVKITKKGKLEALRLIRKHRLWETFLVRKLNFSWDQVHDVAEQLEHINSPLLVSRLDEFLGFPTVDPHGDPIPGNDGKLPVTNRKSLAEMELCTMGTVVAVKDSSSLFLKYLDKIGAVIGSKIEVLDRVDYDGSLEIEIDKKSRVFVSRDVADNIMMV